MRKNYLTDFIERFDASMNRYEHLERSIGIDSLEEFLENGVYLNKLNELRNTIFKSRINEFGVFIDIVKNCSEDPQLVELAQYERILKVREMFHNHKDKIKTVMKKIDKRFKDKTMIKALDDMNVTYTVRRSSKYKYDYDWSSSNGREPIWRVIMSFKVDHIMIINRRHNTSFKLPLEFKLDAHIDYTNINFLATILDNSKMINKVLNNEDEFINLLLNTDTNVLPFTSTYRVNDNSYFSNHPFYRGRGHNPCFNDFEPQIYEALRSLDFISYASTIKSWLTTYYLNETNPHHYPNTYLYMGIPEDAGSGISEFNLNEDNYLDCWNNRSTGTDDCDSLNCALRNRCVNYLSEIGTEDTPAQTAPNEIDRIMSERATSIIRILQSRDSLNIVNDIIHSESIYNLDPLGCAGEIIGAETDLYDDLKLYFTTTQGDTPNEQ